MQKTLIIYESKYGTTQKAAKYLSLILGPAKYCKTEEFIPAYRDFDFIVIGTPIYSGNVHPKISKFIEENKDWLKQKKVALFSSCLSKKDGEENLENLKKNLGTVIKMIVLGGRLKLDSLDEIDSSALKEFSEKLGFELSDMDSFNLEDLINYGLELKQLKEDLIQKMPAEKLKKHIEDFLTTHNTCTLSTAYKQRVRSTPLEYNYKDGFIYLLSEGGEKFANLLVNSNVSMAVYEDYTTMNNLAGMQISGSASLIDLKSQEYLDILKLKGLNSDVISKLQINMNIIKIEIDKVEFLYSKFKDMGFEVKQIYFFK